MPAAKGDFQGFSEHLEKVPRLRPLAGGRGASHPCAATALKWQGIFGGGGFYNPRIFGLFGQKFSLNP